MKETFMAVGSVADNFSAYFLWDGFLLRMHEHVDILIKNSGQREVNTIKMVSWYVNKILACVKYYDTS